MRIGRDQRGQATVELALCLPLLAIVLGALVEVGLVVADQARLWQAARDAARVAVVDSDFEAVTEAAGRSGLANLEVRVDPEPASRVRGEPLTVSLSYHPPGKVPLLGALFERVELQAAATMRIENP
jgi:TadE-like protein